MIPLGVLLRPLALLGLVLLSVPSLHGQTAPLAPVTVGSPMPDISLPVFQGGDLALSQLRGKNVLILFPRGLSRPDSWCHVCPYQHAELAEYEAATGFRERANLEILWVLPYDAPMIRQWIADYPQLLRDIEEWKNPADPAGLDEAGRARMERSRRAYPRTFPVGEGEVPNPFPILVDAERTLSGGLGFFTTEWRGSQAEQNVPAVLLIDAQGIVQFKYISQTTLDRPPLEYLVRVVEHFTGSGR